MEESGSHRHSDRAPMSQSPQTGQVYFNNGLSLKSLKSLKSSGHNPLKRVKFISMQFVQIVHNNSGSACHNPLKRVKFISIQNDDCDYVYPTVFGSHNPLKRVKFISMQLWLFAFQM